jgi:putative membrane protein
VSEQSRLPVQAIPVMVLESGLLLIAAVPALTVSGSARALVVVPLALGLVGPAVRWLRFRYTVAGDLLILEGGLLFRWRREIPFARVQSVDVVQKLRHRLFGVVELRIEVIGGGTTEASFPALQPPEAERLRSIVLSGEHALPVEEASPALARMTPADLLLAGATGGRVAVVALLLGYAQELLPEDAAYAYAERLAQSGLVAIALLVGGFLLVSVAVSLVATIVVYWNFTVRREGGRVVITRGLLERRRALIPLNRVQALRVAENPVRRLLGLASVSAVLAGYTANREEGEETSVVLPVARRDQALALVEQLLGLDAQLAALHLEGASSRGLARRLVRVAGGTLVLGTAAVATIGARGAGVLVLLPLGAVWAWMSWRGMAHALTDDHVFVRSGALARRLYVVPVANVQHLELKSSPLERVLSLATLRLRIPKASPVVTDLIGTRAGQRFDALAGMLVR